MILDFFQKDCQEQILNIAEFGLCDDQDGGKAYVNFYDKEKWIATVKNKETLPLTFTAIDKCILFDNDYKGQKRCDGMITSENILYLVELKNQNPPWQDHAIEQLESTIQLLMDNHDISNFKKRKVIACNKKRSAFIVIDNEFKKTFFKRTSFRIDLQAEIIVI
jgi:hypothetical protein